jgi:hypothetical protein
MCTDDPSIDLGPDTTQGAVYRFLLGNADRAFRQREIVEAVDVPEGSVGPTLHRLEERALLNSGLIGRYHGVRRVKPRKSNSVHGSRSPRLR